jgi:hypothetical protein
MASGLTAESVSVARTAGDDAHRLLAARRMGALYVCNVPDDVSQRLVVRFGSSHLKPHRSRCDLAAAFEVDEALGAVRAVAVGDVAGEGVVEGVPVEVVGVLDDELTDRQEVALDAV